MKLASISLWLTEITKLQQLIKNGGSNIKSAVITRGGDRGYPFPDFPEKFPGIFAIPGFPGKKSSIPGFPGKFSSFPGILIEIS